MCVIIVMEDKIPSLDVFKRCEEKNSHGGGISWVEDGKVYFKKGIKSKEMHRLAMAKGTPCVAHFRISTVGGTSPELCHPFPVSKTTGVELSGTCGGALFHNGHWRDWEDKCLDMILNRSVVLPDGVWSDSRAIAWLVGCANDSFLAFIDQKVAIQTKNGITRYGDWKEKEGVLYSNLNWDCRISEKFSSKWPDWNKDNWGKNNKIGYGEYHGTIYGIDEKGKVLLGDVGTGKDITKDTDTMTEKEKEDHYTQLALEYEINKNCGY